jgi:hypothetical protein
MTLVANDSGRSKRKLQRFRCVSGRYLAIPEWWILGPVHLLDFPCSSTKWRSSTMDFGQDNVTASLEEVVRYNVLLTEAIFELLAEKDVLSGAEVLERVKKLKVETMLKFRPVQ